jgi:hypothetical protein
MAWFAEQGRSGPRFYPCFLMLNGFHLRPQRGFARRKNPTSGPPLELTSFKLAVKPCTITYATYPIAVD